MKVKIVNVKPVPRWKFWKIDNFEVTVELPNGKTKTFTIFYQASDWYEQVFLTFIKNKLEMGKQFGLRTKEITPEDLSTIIGKEIEVEQKGLAGRVFRLNREKVEEALREILDELYNGFPDEVEQWMKEKMGKKNERENCSGLEAGEE